MENKSTNQALQELVMLFTIIVKRSVPQSTLIQEMNAVGFEPKRIAELLRTTPNTVSVAINRFKKMKGK